MDAFEAIDEQLRRLVILQTALLMSGKYFGTTDISMSIKKLESALVDSVTVKCKHVPFKYRIAVSKGE